MTAAFSLPKISLFHSLPGLPHEIDKGSLLYYPSILPRTQSLFSHSQHTQLAYIDALDLYHSLESRSSCHREATSSIMLDCSALGYEDINEDIKINYAVKLAICELRGTGIVYPKECDNLPTHTENGSATERKRTMRCIKRLEERPQYWTTLSNNIQNAMLLCNAARQGMEKG